MNRTQLPSEQVIFFLGGSPYPYGGDPRGSASAGPPGAHPNIFPPKRTLDDSLVDWPALVARQLEPFFNQLATTLPTYDFYQESKKLACWPALVRSAAVGLWRVNHKTMPRTLGDVVMALDIEHFIEVVKREGREAFPDYEARVELLERVGFRAEAEKARNAAKNARTNLSRGVPRSCTTSSALRENLATAWLPCGLWALSDSEVAAALPRMRNRDGTLLCGHWQQSCWGPAGRYETGREAAEQARKAVSRMRNKLGLVSSKDLCGVECGRLADGIVMKASADRWERIERVADIK